MSKHNQDQKSNPRKNNFNIYEQKEKNTNNFLNNKHKKLFEGDKDILNFSNKELKEFNRNEDQINYQDDYSNDSDNDEVNTKVTTGDHYNLQQMYLLEEHLKQEREKIAPKNSQKKFAFDQYTIPINSDDFQGDLGIYADYKEGLENREVIHNKEDNSHFLGYGDKKNTKPKISKAFKVDINSDTVKAIANGEINLDDLEQLLTVNIGNPGIVQMSRKEAEDLIKENHFEEQTEYVGEVNFPENSSDDE